MVGKWKSEFCSNTWHHCSYYRGTMFLALAEIVSRLKSVEAIKLQFVAPMPEQIVTTTMQILEVQWKAVSWHLRGMHCCGANLFWQGCNKCQNIGPQRIDSLAMTLLTCNDIRRQKSMWLNSLIIYFYLKSEKPEKFLSKYHVTKDIFSSLTTYKQTRFIFIIKPECRNLWMLESLIFLQFWTYLDESWQEDWQWDPNNRKNTEVWLPW